MKYASGDQVKLGDRIRISNGEMAVVVISADSGEYDESFPKEEWKDIRDGILVKTDSGALVQFDQSLCNELERIQ